MADTNFIETYMPAYVELPQEEIYAVRERLVSYLRTKFDEVDVVPNTVVGDLIVTPQAWTLSALEKGLDRVLSDLNTANIAENVIYNCDFVMAWLKNFVNGAKFTRPSSGIVRLTYPTAEARVLDRATQFMINGDIYTIYLPNTGAFIIVPPGEEVPVGTNGTVLVDTGSGMYFCDVPVIGETNTHPQDTVEAIDANTGVTAVTPIPDQLNMTTLTAFDPGYTSYSARQMAAMSQMTIYAATMSSRNGAIRYITETCPFVESVYPIINGDRELLREYRNQYGTASGCMDLYVRSKSFEFTETQSLRLYAVDIDEATGEYPAYEGFWSYSGQPYHIESLTSPAVPSILNIPHTITSTNTKGLGALAAYTPAETLHIRVEDVKDEHGDSIFTPRMDENGKLYAEFTIVYQTDPSLRAIATAAESSDNRPINTSLHVRGFIPVIIDSFEVVYVREEGVVPDLSSARDNIKIYLAGVGAPSVYSDGEIARIMKQAGAKYVKEVRVNAHVQWSVAQKINDYEGNIVDVPQEPIINTSAGLRVDYPAPTYQITAQDMYACSTRNIRYYLMENSVVFSEVKEM
jgi:hypothetical protein